MTADLQLQLDVLAEVLREDPDGADASGARRSGGRESSRSHRGYALARALRELDNEGLVISDGLLVRPSRPALHSSA